MHTWSSLSNLCTNESYSFLNIILNFFVGDDLPGPLNERKTLHFSG